MQQVQINKNKNPNLNLESISLEGKNISKAILNIIPKKVAQEYKIIAFDFVDGPKKQVKIAVANPDKLKSKAPSVVVDLKKKKKINIKLFVTTLRDFEYALGLYDKTEDKKPEAKKELLNDEIYIKKDKNINQNLNKTTIPNLRPLPDHLKAPLDPKKPIPDKPQTVHAPIVDKKTDLKQDTINNSEIEDKEKNKDSKKTSKDVNLVDLSGKQIPFSVLSKFPKEVASKFKMVVFSAPIGENNIKVGLVNPDDENSNKVLDFIKNKNKVNILKYKISQKDFEYVLSMYDRGTAVVNENKGDSIPSAEPLPENKNKKLPPLIKKEKIEKTELKEENKENKVENIEEVDKESEEIESDDVKGINQNMMLNIANTEEQEKNLDVLLPNGVKSKDNLTQIIKDGMIPKIVSAIIYFAVEQNASDIHLEPIEDELRLRFRMDGILHDVIKMPIQLHPPIVSRIKIMSHLRIDEQRVPQDGRFSVNVDKKEIDIRVSSLPTVNGEKIAMRLLDKSAGLKDIKELGFQGTNLERILENIKKPYGIIFTTGPTGSGKTTTLYSLLKELNQPGVNIVTFEDPVEYEIEGINQCQIKPKIGFNFAEGLRSVLRQDPNIIMVGEVRDAETASMSVHAALTGHLVLSTLHTNSASGALPRIINMGIEPFLATSAINCIIAQRLVRKICPKCKEKFTPPAPTLEKIKQSINGSNNQEIKQNINRQLQFYKPKGCSYCKDGYKGRIGLYEILNMSDKIEDLAVRKQPADVIQKQAVSEGMITLRQDGILKALQGLTSLDEVLKETSE